MRVQQCRVTSRQRATSLARWRRYLALSVLLLLGLSPSVTIPADNTLILGVFPRRNPSEMTEMFAPLADYLSHQLGQPVKIETMPDFNSFWDAVAAKRYHLVHYNQYHYVRSHKQLGYQLVAMNEEQGKSQLAGVIMVRSDSGIRSLADLRGRIIVFGGNKHAMNSYVTPTYLLRQAGLKAGDYQEEFATNPPNVALSVFFKRHIAGGIGDIVSDTPFVREKVDVSKLMVIAKSPPVPHLPWAVRGDIPVPLRVRIQQALLEVKQSPDAARILKAAALSGIVAAEDSQYDYVRKVIATVMGEHY